jgi:hypothetical protein
MVFGPFFFAAREKPWRFRFECRRTASRQAAEAAERNSRQFYNQPIARALNGWASEKVWWDAEIAFHKHVVHQQAQEESPCNGGGVAQQNGRLGVLADDGGISRALGLHKWDRCAGMCRCLRDPSA